MEYIVKPFEVSPYNVGLYIIKNPQNSRYEMISAYQAALLENLERDPNPVKILFPANGVATSRHFEQCISLFRCLSKLSLLEEKKSEDEVSKSTKLTNEIFSQISAVHFLDPTAETILVFSAKFLAKLRTWGIFILLLAAIFASILLLPPITENMFAGLSCFVIYFTLYAGFCVAFSTREIFRAAFLEVHGRALMDLKMVSRGPFLSLHVDGRDIWMNGHAARMQLALVGICGPFVSSALVCVGAHLGIFPDNVALLWVGATFLTSAVLLFPLAAADGEEILHLALSDNKLDKNLAESARAAIANFGREGFLQQRILLTLVATTVWTILWADFLRSSLEIFLPMLSADISGEMGMVRQIGAGLFIIAGILLLLFPALSVLYAMLQEKIKKLRFGVDSKIVRDPKDISWEEKHRRLAQIPLFAFLGEDVRDSLLEDMQNHTFEAGDYLVKQGEAGRDLFVLLKGEATAIFKDAIGKIYEVGTLKEGDAFGEVALIDDVPRTASIVAKTTCFALSLSKEDFERHILQQITEVDRIKQMIRLSSFFKRHPLLSRLDARDQAKVIEKFRFRSVVAHEQLTGSDSGEAKFFLVYTGKLAVDSDRDEEFILGSEDCFGYLLPGQNPAYLPKVKAKEGSGLLSLSQADFKELIFDRVLDNAEILKC